MVAFFCQFRKLRGHVEHGGDVFSGFLFQFVDRLGAGASEGSDFRNGLSGQKQHQNFALRRLGLLHLLEGVNKQVFGGCRIRVARFHVKIGMHPILGIQQNIMLSCAGVGIELKKDALNVQPDPMPQKPRFDLIGIGQFDQGIMRQVVVVYVSPSAAFKKRPGESVGHVDDFVGQFHGFILCLVMVRFHDGHSHPIWVKAKGNNRLFWNTMHLFFTLLNGASYGW